MLTVFVVVVDLSESLLVGFRVLVVVTVLETSGVRARASITASAMSPSSVMKLPKAVIDL